MNKIKMAVIAVSLIALLVACDILETLTAQSYYNVQVEVYFDTIDPLKLKANELTIYKDKIEIYKYVRNKKGDLKLYCLEFRKSEYDSLYFKPVSN